ncbi:unnamed protein product, partial [Rhizoctonia solani]
MTSSIPSTSVYSKNKLSHHDQSQTTASRDHDIIVSNSVALTSLCDHLPPHKQSAFHHLSRFVAATHSISFGRLSLTSHDLSTRVMSSFVLLQDLQRWEDIGRQLEKTAVAYLDSCSNLELLNRFEPDYLISQIDRRL